MLEFLLKSRKSDSLTFGLTVAVDFLIELRLKTICYAKDFRDHYHF